MDHDGERARARDLDPRPLLGEPLALDLVNTVWRDAAGPRDLLADLPGLQVWLTEHGFSRTPPVEATRSALVEAREALRAHVAVLVDGGPGAAAAVERRLDAVLARGSLVRELRDGRPRTHVHVADPADLPAWTAVEDYLQLLDKDASRIRRCAGSGCVLHFFDVSRRGDRRWCSMAGCGNRAKAARHYARTRPGQDGDDG